MVHQAFLPGDVLKPYVKCYWVYAKDKANHADTIYPSGYLELAFNLSAGNLTTIINGQHIPMPPIEVLGQLTAPAQLLVPEGIALLVVRFYPHASFLFFPNRAADFTNASISLTDVFGKQADQLYQQLMQPYSLKQKIDILELFLIQQLKMNEKKLPLLKFVERICHHAANDEEKFNIQNLASKYGYSERYMQKLFLEYVGLTPKTFHSIQRFNKSLSLVQSSLSSLTSIAYECGYSDQSHFIKTFKTFAGKTPLEFQRSLNA
jgi:AraC-like DNA-binding protein